MSESMEVTGKVQQVIEPYVVRPAVCREHDPRAAEVARRIDELVSRHLPHIHAEHVGSTSVPGCAGKGIVDLMISVPDGEMEKVKLILDRLGFQPQTRDCPDFRANENGTVPFAVPMRVGSCRHDGETFLLHVHVIPANSPGVDEMRFFRACLRADPELVRAYVARKRKIIADGVTDSLEYCRMKGEFLKSVFG
jgi:GrpB-like predicted nucleotidyltransferase (UPF0157 family)